MSERNHLIRLLALHGLLALYSLGGVFSKAAASNPFLSPTFLFFYGLVLAILAIYALGWQQVIKRMPLTVAFANKAITVVWGIFWGVVLFGDTLTVGKVVGAALVIVGIILFALIDDSRMGLQDE